MHFYLKRSKDKCPYSFYPCILYLFDIIKAILFKAKSGIMSHFLINGVNYDTYLLLDALFSYIKS